MSRTSQFRTVKRIGSFGLTLAVLLSMTLTGAVIAHTGSITATQDCETYTVKVRLDANVAAEATWVVKSSIPGTTAETTGTGPGPDEIVTFSGAAPVTGEVTLDITYQNEEQHYSKTLTPKTDCGSAGGDEETPCPDGQVRTSTNSGGDGDCHEPPCPDGQVRTSTNSGSQGDCHEPPCPDGQVRTSTNSGSQGDCHEPPCPDGQVRTSTNSGGSDGDGCEAEADTASINVTKTAADSSVNAGDQIRFTVTLDHSGATATGVDFSDTLPSGDGISWSIVGTPAGWEIVGNELRYTPTTLSADTSVQVVSNTTNDSCGTYKNTAEISWDNEGSSDSKIKASTNNSNQGGSGHDGGSDKDSATVTVSGCEAEADTASIDVTKTADDASVTAGSQIGFTVTLDHSGTTATGVEFSDTLPSGDGISWSIVGTPAGWEIVGNELRYTPTTLSADTSVHVVSNTTNDSCGTYENKAKVTWDNAASEEERVSITTNNGNDGGSGGDGEHKGGSDQASATVTVSGCVEPEPEAAVIDLTKTADAASVSAGSQIGFTVTLSNTSDVGATGVVFTDTLPTGPGISWSIVGTPAGWEIVGNELRYSPTTLAANTSTSVHVVSNTTSASCDDYENTAKVSWDAGENSNGGEHDKVTVSTGGGAPHGGGTDEDEEHDGDGDGDGERASDQATATTTVLCAAINLTKTADAPSVIAGATIGFTITVTNGGLGIATGVHVTDVLPTDAGLSWTAGPVTGPNAAGVTCAIAAGSLVCDTASLPSGGSFSVHISSPTTAATAATSPVSNTAVVTTTNNGTDEDTDEVIVTPPATAPALSAVKLVATNDGTFAATGTAVPGDTLHYQITVSNTGTGAASSVIVTDDVSDLLANGDYNGDCAPAGICGYAAPVISWTIPTIAAGGNVVLTFSVDLDDVFPAGETHLTNFVVVNDQGVVCPPGSTAPECGGTDTEVDANPDLNVVKAVATNDGSFGPTSNATPGDVLHYRITITNVGNANATNVAASDNIAALLAFGDYNADCNLGCTYVEPVISWNIPTIAANGGSATLTFSIDLDESIPAGTVLPNVAVVTGPGSNCPPGSTNPDCDTTTTVSLYQLELTKTNDAEGEELLLPDGSIASLPTADEGETVTYTLSYTIGTLDVTNGTLVDVLPEGVTYDVGSATVNGEFTSVTYAAGILTWTASNVTTAGSVSYTVTVDLGANELSQPLTNVATIDSAETAEDVSTSDIFVPVPPLGETDTPPVPPAPNTDILDDGTKSTPGLSLTLILAILATIVIGIGFVTPVPAAVRRRNRR